MTDVNGAQMKRNLILGALWIGIALYDLSLGAYFLYQYSTPSVLWLYMVPTWITFTKIFLGATGLLIGLGIVSRGDHILILPLAALMIIFIAIDLIKMGFESLHDSGSNLILLLLAVLTIRLTSEIQLTIFRKPRVLVVMAIGLAPYLFVNYLSYSWFNFLH
jgi:hypothetical protein